ncbi:acyltransferase family protein [Nocardia uniformis]|uniref:Acyltransferase family protein n=1 Tax=Nocardia uniformis TaxID=53432 RepID=A0A849C282_9NOCA|nr:acyltransferase family protein [Nocardia uniformis]NNH70540.1 acyltransferase family protein [Nocardia uniformis]
MLFLDNLKVLLIVLVIGLHAAQPYGPADWWYVEGDAGLDWLPGLTAMVGTFLMSLFLFVSGYFVPSVFDRKGARGFLLDRFTRFGPLILVGFFGIVAVLMYAYYTNFRGYPPMTFPSYYWDVYLGQGEQPADWSGPIWPDRQFGHLWFIQHLLVYSLIYTLWRWVSARSTTTTSRVAAPAPPGTLAIVGFIGFLAALTFMIRLRYPVDTWVPLLEFIQAEPADLAHQASFFFLGALAYRRGWLTAIPATTGYRWLAVGTALATTNVIIHRQLAEVYAAGGPTMGSLIWSVVETVMCVSLSIGLIVLFREHARRSSGLLLGAAALTFTVYLIHVPIVVALQYLAAAVAFGPLPAVVGVSVLGVAVSFALAWLIKKTPYLKRLL